MNELPWERRPAIVWRIVLGVILLLILWANSTRLPNLQPDDVSGILGRFTGQATLFVGGVFLINSGLRRPFGEIRFAAVRRRLWLLLVCAGFLVAAVLVGILGRQAPIGVFVVWLLAAWPIAGVIAKRRAPPVEVAGSS